MSLALPDVGDNRPVLVVAIGVADECIEHEVADEDVEPVAPYPVARRVRWWREGAQYSFDRGERVLRHPVEFMLRVAVVGMRQEFVAMDKALPPLQEAPRQNGVIAAGRRKFKSRWTRDAQRASDLVRDLLAPIFAAARSGKLEERALLRLQVEEPRLSLRAHRFVFANVLGNLIIEINDREWVHHRVIVAPLHALAIETVLACRLVVPSPAWPSASPGHAC